MKRYIYIFSMLTALVFLYTGCEKKYTTEDTSKITYYVDITLVGDEVMTIEQGSAYTEPGYIAMEGETDVTASVEVAGSVDANTVGLYTLSYSAENQDEWPASKSRTVIVYDPAAPATDLTGTWDGQRVGRGGGPIDIEMVAPGIFFCSDMFGGYYEVVAGYGSAYRLVSYIQLLADNTYVPLQTNSPWGPWDIQGGVYDPGTETMSHMSYFTAAAFGFDVLLTKQ